MMRGIWLWVFLFQSVGINHRLKITAALLERLAHCAAGDGIGLAAFADIDDSPLERSRRVRVFRSIHSGDLCLRNRAERGLLEMLFEFSLHEGGIRLGRLNLVRHGVGGQDKRRARCRVHIGRNSRGSFLRPPLRRSNGRRQRLRHDPCTRILSGARIGLLFPASCRAHRQHTT